eukprot:580523-Pyramimonas_sp.AAC.1
MEFLPPSTRCTLQAARYLDHPGDFCAGIEVLVAGDVSQQLNVIEAQFELHHTERFACQFRQLLEGQAFRESGADFETEEGPVVLLRCDGVHNALSPPSCRAGEGGQVVVVVFEPAH